MVSDWEDATSPAEQAGTRVVRVRTGIVQSPAGGTLRLLRPLFTAGLGGRLGNGQQWFSWIGIDDLVDVYHRALWDTDLSGPVNAVAPDPVRNVEYTRVLAQVLHRPALLPVPPLGPKVLLGEQGARELALRQPAGAARATAASRSSLPPARASSKLCGTCWAAARDRAARAFDGGDGLRVAVELDPHGIAARDEQQQLLRFAGHRDGIAATHPGDPFAGGCPQFDLRWHLAQHHPAHQPELAPQRVGDRCVKHSWAASRRRLGARPRGE